MPTIDDLQKEIEILKREKALALLEKQTQYIPKPVELPKPSWLARLGRGMLDGSEGVQQLYYRGKDAITGGNEADEFEKLVNQNLDMYNRGMKDHDGIDWARIGGNVAITAPAMLLPGGQASALSVRAGSSALGGGLASGSMYTRPDEGGNILKDKAINTAIGMGVGGAVPFVTNAAANIGSKAVNSVPKAANNIASRINIQDKILVPIDTALKRYGMDLTKVSDQSRAALIKEAKAQLNASGKLDADALARKAVSETLGFVDDSAMTTAQVTRSPKGWAAERNLQKVEGVGDDITGRYQNQNRRFMELKGEMQKSAGVSAKGEGEVSRNIFTSVTDKWDESQRMVGSLYKQARDDFGDLEIDVSGLLKSEAFDDLVDDDMVSPLMNTVVNRLKRKGIIEVVDGEMQATGKMLPLKEAEQLRKWINSRSSNDPTLLRAKRMVVDAFDDEVFDQLGDDVFKQARSAARERFSEFESKLLNKIVNDKLQPSQVFDELMKATPEDIAALKTSLNTGFREGDAIGGQAWNDFKGELYEWIWNKATAGKGADGTFSGHQFKSALDKIGADKLKVIFEPQELRQLKNIKKTGIDMTYAPAFSSVNYSNTAPTLLNYLTKSKLIPYMGNAMSESADKAAKTIEANRVLSGLPYDEAAIRGQEEALRMGILNHLNKANKTGVPMGLLMTQD